jgi:hypothetical protein
MSDSNLPEQVGVIPAFYVDAVNVVAQPFTIQVVLGAADLTGQVAPCVHLTLSPAFAAHVAELLRRAAEHKRPPVAGEPLAVGRVDPIL